jgi:hypothetical protein
MNPLAGLYDLAALYWAGISSNPAMPEPVRVTAAHLSGASDMLAAASDPASANFIPAWTGRDIFVKHDFVPGLGWVRTDGR